MARLSVYFGQTKNPGYSRYRFIKSSTGLLVGAVEKIFDVPSLPK